MKNSKPNEQTRKEFLAKFGIIGALIIGIGMFLRNLFLFITPAKDSKTYHKYLVGKETEIPVGKAKQIKIHGKPVFVVHLENGFKVLSGVCTHLGCMVNWQENKKQFYCPCHQGFFDVSGKVIAGPPPEPLEEFKVEQEGKLIFAFVEDKMKGPWA